MAILCVDTTMGLCSASIIVGDKVVYHIHNKKSSQSEEMFNVINAALQESKLKLEHINKAFCCIGPGSFTGIRIGVAAIRGLKIAFPELEIHGVTNMELLNFSAAEKEVHTILNAYRDQLYSQKFISNRPQDKIELIYQSDLKNAQNISADNSLRKVFDKPNINFVDINAELLAKYILSKPTKEPFPDCSPIYIRPPDAKPPKRMFDL